MNANLPTAPQTTDSADLVPVVVMADLAISREAWEAAGYGELTGAAVAEWLSNALFAGTSHISAEVRSVGGDLSYLAPRS